MKCAPQAAMSYFGAAQAWADRSLWISDGKAERGIEKSFNFFFVVDAMGC